MKLPQLSKIIPILAISMLLGTSAQSQVVYSVGVAPLADAGPDLPLVGDPPLVLPLSGGLLVTMNGFATTDEDSPLAATDLVWTLGSTTLTGFSPTFTFTTAGPHVVTLTVTDSDGNVDTDTVTITITSDICAPVITTPASGAMVECDGSGNLVALNAWLNSHGGAVATDDCGPVVWTHNYTTNSIWSNGTYPVCEQIAVTFTATDPGGNFTVTTATFQIKDTTAPPLNWTVNGTPVADFTILTVPCNATVTVKVLPADICTGSTLQKSYAFLNGNGTITYSSSTSGVYNDTVTLTNATNNAKVRFYFKATDYCGNSSATEWVEIDVDKKCLSLKGNEGVGNGIDPDTPGALHNGNNDAPGFFPGNPGARHKHL